LSIFVASVKNKDTWKWGFIDKKGKEVTPFIYDYPYSGPSIFSDGFYKVFIQGLRKNYNIILVLKYFVSLYDINRTSAYEIEKKRC